MSDINVGAITEALNDKMDRDAHNVQSPSAVVVEKMDPTAGNNYTWYRKYSDGWVEQGGTCSGDSSYIISLPITMADTNFAFYSGASKNVIDGACITANIDKTYSITTSGFRILCRYGGGNATEQLWWEVKGMTAS